MQCCRNVLKLSHNFFNLYSQEDLHIANAYNVMFRNINIENFRGVKSVQVGDLRRVNLFFGKNNCGKSSLLEALYLITEQSNPLLPVSINNFRNYSRVTEKDIILDFYGLDATKEIHISAEADDGKNRDLRIAEIKSNSNKIALEELEKESVIAPNGFYGLRLSYSLGNSGTVYKSDIVIKNDGKNEAKINSDSRYKEDIESLYLPSAYSQYSVTKKYAQIVENKQENYIVDILRTIEPRIKDMQLVGNSLMVDVGLPQRLPVNVMGDGIRKLLYIIIAIYECQNGILLIDEVDNGFHYSAMSLLWKAILYASKNNNTQVFVTTHNIDSLKGLVNVLHTENATEKQDVAAFKLIKKDDDSLKALRYDYEQMSYAIEQEMEMR